MERTLINLHRNSPKVTDQPVTNIINHQLDIKLKQFTKEEPNVVLAKIKNRRAARLNEVFQEVWKTRKFNDFLLRYCNTANNQNAIERWILPFPKKGDLGIAKKYRGITLTSIASISFNALLSNCIDPEIKNIL